MRHAGDGTWWDEDGSIWRSSAGKVLRRPPPADVAGLLLTRVILATAHLDHDPGNNSPRNLKALCQRCHLAHDRAEHARRRRITLKMRRAIGDLFLGPYRL